MSNDRAHIESVIEYDLPPNAVRFEAVGGYADGCVPPESGEKLNSWSVTENSNGYQTAYIRLLSKFVE